MVLSGSKWDSIQQMGERDDIIIKPVDKGSANKIMHELTSIHEVIHRQMYSWIAEPDMPKAGCI